MPKNFFELSEDEADDIVAAKFSLPTDMQAKRAKRAAAKKVAPAKRVSAKRLSARRGSAKRGSAKRLSARRISKRRTSRPLVGLFGSQRKVGGAPIPRPSVGGEESVAERARDAARAVLAEYIRWVESSNAGKLYHQLISVSDAASYVAEVAYTAARNARERRGGMDAAEVIYAAGVAATTAAALGNTCVTYARSGRHPSAEERKKIHETFYTTAGNALRRAYDLADGVGEPPAPHVAPPAPPAPRPAAPAARTFSVKEMVDELEDLRMEERLKGLGGQSKDAIDVGEPPERAPRLDPAKQSEKKRLLSNGWTQLLRFIPHTVNQLGIAREVKSGTFAQRWLGSGAYATAFAMPDPMYVLKLTTDPEDAFISMKLAEASQKGEPPEGLIRTYVVFRIGLPFRIETSLSGSVDTAYGMVTERAINLTDYANNELKHLRDPLIAKAMKEAGIDRLKADRMLRDAWQQAMDVVQGAYEKYQEDHTPFEEYIDSKTGQPSPVEKEFRAGIAWCNARGLKFGADAHYGNFAIVWRDGRFQGVKSDLGHYSVKAGRGVAIDGASRLTLAANSDE